MCTKKIRVGIVLSGSGVYDGTEIHEAVLTLYHLDKLGASVHFFAPDIAQMHVINHQTQTPDASASRSVLAESARIAKGPVTDIREARIEDLDAAIFPGGFGAAKNLSSFATQGQDCTVNEDVATFIRSMNRAKKPLGFMCIAPVLAAKVLGNVTVTIGQDPDTASAISSFNSTHQNAQVDDIVLDSEQRVVTTPAYMLGASISEISVGIEKLVEQVHQLALEPVAV